MDEIMEVSVGALHLLARDPASRMTIRQLNSIPFFVLVSITYLLLVVLHVVWT